MNIESRICYRLSLKSSIQGLFFFKWGTNKKKMWFTEKKKESINKNWTWDSLIVDLNKINEKYGFKEWINMKFQQDNWNYIEEPDGNL